MRKAIAAAVLALSCSSSAPSGGDVSLDKVPGELSKVFCERIYGCCSAAERMNNPFVGTDQTSCQTALGALLSFVVPSVQASVSAGRAAYHGDKLGSCVSQLRAASCANLKMNPMGVGFTTVPECKQAFEPKVALGGACSDTGDCIAGYCAGATDTMLGKCAPLKADGQSCIDDEECTNGGCVLDKCARPTGNSGGICN